MNSQFTGKQGIEDRVKRTPQENNHTIQNVGHPIQSWLRVIFFSGKWKKKWGPDYRLH